MLDDFKACVNVHSQQDELSATTYSTDLMVSFTNVEAITTWKHVVRHSISLKKKHITFSELTLRGVTYVTALILPNFKRSGNGAVFTKKYRDTNIYTVNVKNSSVLLCNQRSFPSIILKNTFHYNSDLWINKTDYNIPGGKTGFDSQETKLPAY